MPEDVVEVKIRIPRRLIELMQRAEDIIEQMIPPAYKGSCREVLKRLRDGETLTVDESLTLAGLLAGMVEGSDKLRQLKRSVSFI